MRFERLNRDRGRGRAWSLGVPLWLLSCGKPATEAECTEIVARIAELEAKAVASADPAEVARQVAEAKSEFSDRAKRECVGKRIRADAVECVRKATTAQEIVKRCLD